MRLEVARDAERVGAFAPPQGSRLPPPERWGPYLISDRPVASAADPEKALAQLPGWAQSIERAMGLYVKWANESPRHKVQRRGMFVLPKKEIDDLLARSGRDLEIALV